jgi:hypothetical protein
MATNFQLHPYADEAAGALALNIEGHVSFSESRLELQYVISGDALKNIIWPQHKSPSQPCDNLWQHTCFECFLANAAATGYFEFNFSPSGDWAAYRFDKYRSAMTHAEIAAQAIQIQFSHQTTQALMQVNVTTPQSWNLHNPLDVAICAVIESDATHYYALSHTADKPDFHQRDSFVLRLD